MATTDKTALEGKVAAELHQIATDLGIEGHKGLKKAELVDAIVAHTNGGTAAGAPPAFQAPERSSAADAVEGNGSSGEGANATTTTDTSSPVTSAPPAPSAALPTKGRTGSGG